MWLWLSAEGFCPYLLSHDIWRCLKRLLDYHDDYHAGATDFLCCTEKGPPKVVKANVGTAETESSACASCFSHHWNTDDLEREEFIWDHDVRGVNPSSWGGLGRAEQFISWRASKQRKGRPFTLLAFAYSPLYLVQESGHGTHSPLWKHPHRYTQRCASLMSEVTKCSQVGNVDDPSHSPREALSMDGGRCWMD